MFSLLPPGTWKETRTFLYAMEDHYDEILENIFCDEAWDTVVAVISSFLYPELVMNSVSVQTTGPGSYLQWGMNCYPKAKLFRKAYANVESVFTALDDINKRIVEFDEPNGYIYFHVDAIFLECALAYENRPHIFAGRDGHIFFILDHYEDLLVYRISVRKFEEHILRKLGKLNGSEVSKIISKLVDIKYDRLGCRYMFAHENYFHLMMHVHFQGLTNSGSIGHRIVKKRITNRFGPAPKLIPWGKKR